MINLATENKVCLRAVVGLKFIAFNSATLTVSSNLSTRLKKEEDRMLILKPEKVNFQISTTNLIAKYTEDAKVEIIVEGLLINDYIERKRYTEFIIEFNTVAELRCKTVNFEETNYNSFKIIDVKNSDIDDYNFWLNNEYCVDSGFYKVEKSKWLNEMNSIYDPNLFD